MIIRNPYAHATHNRPTTTPNATPPATATPDPQPASVTPTATPDPQPATPAPTSAEIQASRDFAAELARDLIGVKFAERKPGKTRTLTRAQRQRAAEVFGSDSERITGSKRLYPRDQPHIRRIWSIVSAARASFDAWGFDAATGEKRKTKGKRGEEKERGAGLIRRADFAEFVSEFDRWRDRLDQALRDAEENSDQIHADCAEYLGSELYDPANYPADFSTCASISWREFNFEPSDKLLQLAPETYKRETERVRSMLMASVANFEAESRDQLAKLTDALLAKIGPQPDGKTVKYTEAAVKNLRTFFDRFQRLNVSNNAELNALVENAKAALGGAKMADLKQDPGLRGAMTAQFGQIARTLDSLTIAAPARSIDIDDLDD